MYYENAVKSIKKANEFSFKGGWGKDKGNS